MHFQRLTLKYQYQASDMIAQDKTPVQSNIVSDKSVDTTATNTATIKSTGYEKYRVSLCFVPKADGTKLPPRIISKNAKREVNAMNIEFKNCIIASSPNDWMNNLTQIWINIGLGSVSF